MIKRSTLVSTTLVAWLSAAAALAQVDCGDTDPLLPVCCDIGSCSCCAGDCCRQPACATCFNGDCRGEVCYPPAQIAVEVAAATEVHCKRGCLPTVCFPWDSCGCGGNRLVDCLCRLCCGSFTYAAYGGPRAAANCCDGCEPLLFVGSDCACDACSHCKCGTARYANCVEKKTCDATARVANWEIRRLPSCQHGGCCDADGSTCVECSFNAESIEQP